MMIQRIEPLSEQARLILEILRRRGGTLWLQELQSIVGDDSSNTLAALERQGEIKVGRSANKEWVCLK